MVIDHLFKERWQQEWRQYSKYLRYVFNDHAMLALLFLLGAAGLAYRQLWESAPVTFWTRSLLLLVLLLTLALFKTPSSFVKGADPVFFMGNEGALRRLFHQATLYSVIVNGVVQLLLTVILWPMMFRLLTPSFITTLLVTVALMAVKMLFTFMKARRTTLFDTSVGNNLIDWRAVVAAEDKRQATILGFFNLFIDVPGMKPAVRRQCWANGLLKHWPNQQRNPLVRLLVTTFVRQGQYWDVWGRLSLIGLLVAFVTTGWLQTILFVILFYLLVLQLLPLASSHRSLVFDHLYPVTVKQRQQAFRYAMMPWFMVTMLIWSIVGGALAGSITLLLQNVIGLVVVGGILLFWYTNRIIANTFRRRNSRAFTK
ncbi:ABC transporter permease [Weissella confusa]